MPINKETIISVFTEKLTLEQWLKTINKALEDAVLTDVEIAEKGNATLSFKFTFEDGTYLETNDIVLQQGESINDAYIQNGHLFLTLTNSQTLDAGNVKPVSNFAINGSQHLIVNYADGTSQDLGAIFQGNVNISGSLNVTGSINGESSPSVKPIYYHGINLETPNHNAILTMVIFDNSNTAYNATRLKQWVNDIVTSVGYLLIACNGNIFEYTDVNEVVRSGHVIAVFVNRDLLAEDQCTITMVSDTGVKSVFLTTLTDLFNYYTGVGDARNKIN